MGVDKVPGHWFQLRLAGQIPFSPIVDRLPANDDIRLSSGVANFEECRKLLAGKAHVYAHLDMARATCLKLVIRHFGPLPTNDARF